MTKKAGDTHALRTFNMLGVAAALTVLSSAALAQPAESFFQGQQIRIIVASGPAGGFDTYARLLARHMGRFLPGNPTFVVQNMPGAGGLRAAGYLAKVASKDGLTIGALQAGMVKAPLLGLTGADFDTREFGWIGSLNSEVMVCISWHTSPIKTIQDAMSKELIVGAASGADTEMVPLALNNLIGTKFKIVTGYRDGPSILLAMQNKEVDGRCGWSWSSIVVQHPDWVRDKQINVLVQVPTQHADLKHLPIATELAKSDDDKQAIEFLFGHLAMSRSFALPPGVPAERLAALRTAFDAMVKDPAVIAEFKKVKQELQPIPGAELSVLVNKFYQAPKPIVEKALASIKPPKR